jgi:rhomboid-like protein
MYRITEVVKNLILLNIIMYVLFSVIFPQTGNAMVLYYFSSEHFRYWQPLTHMFMHANFGHIFFNMIGLYFFGIILEELWGSGRFLRYYLYCGIGSFLLQWAFWYWKYHDTIYLNEVGMLGASGAVMGVIIGVALMAPDLTVQLLIPPIPLKMKYLALIYIAMDLYMGFGTNSNVANFGHLGGALFGFLIITIWRRTGALRM